MRKFLGRGECQSCGANEVIAHSGYRRRCARCDSKMWNEITKLQKSNYMTFGSVHGERQERKWQKSAK
ncbi:MAG: hypothetical protein VX294_04610 [Candidatus Latescibacterota bacterium]|nr:hypothetical protein [Candidatus Latescibacterota bacterium]